LSAFRTFNTFKVNLFLSKLNEIEYYLKKILSVVGARPNFMKMAPLHKELLKYSNKVTHKIVHTGQHYDKQLSEVFFKQLELPKPHINLGVGSGTHASQTAEIMVKFERIVLKEKPDLVIVYGDVNSTLAASVVCAKILLNGKPVPVAHVESGLRSYDMTMPEEVNRLVTDSLADYLFVSEQDGINNLAKSGIQKDKIFFTGNIMIDSLVSYTKKAVKSKILSELCLSRKNYALVTLHRPSNVDKKETLEKIIRIFENINKINPGLDIVFPVHPRTVKMAEKFRLKKRLDSVNNLLLTEPVGYIDFLSLLISAKYVLTDSGGIQEETSFLGVPCLTLRYNTERPVTIFEGTSTLCGLNEKLIYSSIQKIESGNYKKGKKIKFYDGKTAPRIAKIILNKIFKWT